MAVKIVTIDEQRYLYGTNAERVAYSTGSLNQGDKWVHTDSLYVLLWNGVAWVSGAQPVSDGMPPGVPHTTFVLFNATGDLPTLNTDSANINSTMIQHTGFGAGKSRFRATYVQDPTGNRCSGVSLTVNPPDAVAARDNLTMPDVIAAGAPFTANASLDVVRVSAAAPVVEGQLFDANGAPLDIVDIYSVGIRGLGTTDGNTGLMLEVY